MSVTEEFIRAMGIILGPILTPIVFVGSAVGFTTDKQNYGFSVALLLMGVAMLIITVISHYDFWMKKKK